jgi:site-specific DNA-cytosine methylase
MRVLIACEESQAVCIEMRKRGHEAYSCDILPCSGGHPEWHFQCDVKEVLKQQWDMVIAHPPCTYLSVSGLHWNKKYPERAKKTEEALDFVQMFMDLDVERIAIENPVGCISSRIRKPDQIIQPYEFGDDASKKTCLWLKGLPLLESTGYVEPRIVDGKKRWANQDDNGQNRDVRTGKVLAWNSEEIKILRSKTYPGIAKAIAEQWG